MWSTMRRLRFELGVSVHATGRVNRLEFRAPNHDLEAQTHNLLPKAIPRLSTLSSTPRCP